MIPKIIHYCWFGGTPKPEIIDKCIASWKEHCPDWEIREWNESNYDVNAHPYTKEAYEAKKWAFVSDLARLEIVYNCGGVYMDTDVELLSTLGFTEECDAFFAFEARISTVFIYLPPYFAGINTVPTLLPLNRSYSSSGLSPAIMTITLP